MWDTTVSIPSMFESIGKWLASFELNIMDSVFAGAQITCTGAQAPGSLLSNFLIIMMIILFYDMHLYPFIKLTGR